MIGTSVMKELNTIPVEFCISNALICEDLGERVPTAKENPK